jgi:hypothetical protein
MGTTAGPQENYTGRRIGIVGGTVVATYLAYAAGHAIFAPLGPLFAAAVGYGFGIVTHKYWGS